MNSDQNNRTNRDQEQAAEQSAAGNRRTDQSGPMTQPGVDTPEQGTKSVPRNANSGAETSAPQPAERESDRSPSQENL